MESDIKVRIGESATAIIKFEGLVTREGIESLIKLLEIQKEHFPSAVGPQSELIATTNRTPHQIAEPK